MKIYLAGLSGWYTTAIWERMSNGETFNDALRNEVSGLGGEVMEKTNLAAPFVLESFYYSDEQLERYIPCFRDFLLDSGAFTFMMNSKSHVEWNEYVEKYADFIKRNGVEKFFELDIDSVVGYPKVIELRDKLETLTGKMCIPVWHKSRGVDEFYKLCENYPYVAIGGIVSGEIKRNHYKLFPQMIRDAHKMKAKVHGLGFTSLSLLPKTPFDSVDSTSCLSGNKYGHVYKFTGRELATIRAGKGRKVKTKEVAMKNFTEWVKFQMYAEGHL